MDRRFFDGMRGRRIGEAQHPGTTQHDRMRQASKMIIADKAGKEHVGDTFEAAFKDRAFAMRIANEIPPNASESMKMLQCFVKARFAKEDIEPFVASESTNSAAASSDAAAAHLDPSAL